ncbi:hypothetical protein Thi970DRAFT_04657 [Thiorhodovibrio frisius]|uniref:Uncharacterized protein n=1 Tax=Thiorhodovibrio frisius TaxID=631362 RepID=H8Z7W4_9GAMM|nr:hypothetical protein Thi970DRAFT_04657 [Thiorhodovibrio frisius]WPL22033.1 hypothetical protein Thiofri_02182 [Thiorhodovibrio frisius]
MIVRPHEPDLEVTEAATPARVTPARVKCPEAAIDVNYGVWIELFCHGESLTEPP